MIPVVLKTFLRASFFKFQAPLTVSASYARDLQEYWSLRLHSNDELIAAGRDIARLYSSYDSALQENASLHGEISRLEELLRLPSLTAFRSEHARVAQRDFSGWWQRLVIRKGKNFGIPAGAPVIFTGGVVGRIAEVHPYTAVVELVSSPTLRLAAMIDGDSNNRPISFQGGVSPSFAPPRGVIEYVPLGIYASTTVPKTLVTSGLGGVFPAGLVIGQITRVEPSTDGLFQTGDVHLDPRLTSLNEVTVLVPLNPE
ncbi:MAG: rod shape-determining protein MreC [Opitutaceae bacterium]|nr:rod shape-determining protein MreC [Opitutaceae bacterium]